jgi:ribosome-associated toxin RatA of RatAB toxin-antitoxin module
VTITESTIDIAAPAEAIYALAAATERWPDILPHYRSVRTLARNGSARVVEMRAWRHIFPLRWTAEQINDPAAPHIRFRHTHGWTKGMDVEWRFAPLGEGSTRVTIVHRLDFRFPVAAAWLGRHVVSGYFIHGVATRTLAHMKVLAEGASA